MPVALFHKRADGIFDFLEVAAARVVVRVDRAASLAAEQLIQRQPGSFAQDIPQRNVDAADRVAQHESITPVRTDE